MASEKVQYRELRQGEALEIGDEYLASPGEWKTLSEQDYREWCSYASHYNKGEMARFRRPSGKDPELRIKTEQIFAETGDRLTKMMLESLHV